MGYKKKLNILKGISIGSYSTLSTFMHKLDPRSKIVGTLVIVLIAIFTKSLIGYLILSIYIFLLCFISKLNLYGVLSKIKIYIYMTFFMLIFNIFFMRNGYLLVDLKIIKIYDEPVILSLQIGLQIFLLTMVMEMFTTTTRPSDIIKGINYMLNRKGKNSEISLIFTVSIQFINIIYEELKQIIKIQKSRGNNLSGISITRIKELFLIIVPLFRLTIKKINNMAEIMEIKNFRINGKKTEYIPLKFSKKDFLYISVNFLIFFSFFTIFFFDFCGTLI